MKTVPKLRERSGRPNDKCKIQVGCPVCKAATGQRCVALASKGAKKRKQHSARKQLAKQRS